MGSYEEIQHGIRAFIKRFYLLKLLAGICLLIGIESLLFLLLGGIEAWLWLPASVRFTLLVVSMLQILGVCYILIVKPLLPLLDVKQGFSEWEASKTIGKLFPKINDRLTNLVELNLVNPKNELIAASISQRSENLVGFSFSAALTYKPVIQKVKVSMLPVLILLGVVVSKYGQDYTGAINRIIHFNQSFAKPAPFHFVLQSKGLQIFDNQDFELVVSTEGSLRPEEITLVYQNQSFVLEENKGHFKTKLLAPLSTGDFYFEANGYSSKVYTLEVLPHPIIANLEMKLDYPSYVGKATDSIIGSGNARVPEGTRISWIVQTRNTDSVYFVDNEETTRFKASALNEFLHEKQVFTPTNYTISNSNKFVSKAESLTYFITVIPDENPTIEIVQEKADILENKTTFSGTVTDDYGIVSLTAILEDNSNQNSVQEVQLGTFTGNVAEFKYEFPSGFRWDKSGNYSLYFKITDNDPFKGGKTTYSQKFQLHGASAEEIEANRLYKQDSLLKGIQNEKIKNLKLQEDWNKQLKLNNELSEVGFKEKRAVAKLLERQQLQEQMMESFSRELNKTLTSSPSDNEKELLQERIARAEQEAQKNAKLLAELKDLLDDINKEELKDRLEDFSKTQAQNKRSIEQVLELTKKYLVNQSARMLSEQLKKLGDRQEKLSKQAFSEESLIQDSINTAFDYLTDSLKDLERKNQELKKPLTWKRDTPKEDQIQQDLKKASDLLQKNNTNSDALNTEDPSKPQSRAAQKIKELAQPLSDAAGASGSANQRAEDAESLRQILENLIDFSIEQESLIAQAFPDQQLRSGNLIKQKELRVLFEHVDDSLFALSLRQPAISETINKQITDIYYNLDKSLASLSENQINKSGSYQQYVLTGANSLASLLAKVLENLQESIKPGNGNGGGSNFQLPDIIQSQGELQQQLNNSNAQKQQGEGNENGQSGKNGNNKKNESPGKSNDNEIGYEKLFEIYKEQSRIRSALEKQLENINSQAERSRAESILNEMERLENSILDEGITNAVINRMNQIQNNLLKLKDAELLQGEGEERKSNSNRESFQSSLSETKLEEQENALQKIEILNRQPLPLRIKFKEKVKTYFKIND